MPDGLARADAYLRRPQLASDNLDGRGGRRQPRRVTYTMLRSMEPLTQGPAESALIAERLLELSARCATLSPTGVFGKAAARLKETATAFL